MKSIREKLLATCALLGIAATASAQLYIASGSSGVTTRFNFSIDPTLNRVSVSVDNTHVGTGGATGTVTSFGFNAPPALAGSGSLLSTAGVPAATWSYFAPYNLNHFDQHAGAGSGNNVSGGQPHEGVAFGGTGTFVFQFADFADASGFLGAQGVSAKWQGVSTTGTSDEGFGDLDIPPIPEPSTYGLIGAAVLMLGVVIRRKRPRVTPALAT